MAQNQLVRALQNLQPTLRVVAVSNVGNELGKLAMETYDKVSALEQLIKHLMVEHAAKGGK